MSFLETRERCELYSLYHACTSRNSVFLRAHVWRTRTDETFHLDREDREGVCVGGFGLLFEFYAVPATKEYITVKRDISTSYCCLLKDNINLTSCLLILVLI